MASNFDLKKWYLFTYNLCMLAGWGGVAVQIVLSYATTSKLLSAFEAASTLAQMLQIASLLETLHAATGMVRSSVVSNIMQWSGRAHALLCIVQPYVEVRTTAWAAIMLFAWGAGECTRYPWYAYALMGPVPHPLTWLRYTAFIVIYPLGLLAELCCMWQALPLLRMHRPYSLNMPNSINMIFDYATFVQILIMFYPFLWSQLYLDLLRKRYQIVSSPAKLHTA